MKGQYRGMGHSTIHCPPAVILTPEEKAQKKRRAKARALVRKAKDAEAEELAKIRTQHMALDEDKPLG